MTKKSVQKDIWTSQMYLDKVQKLEVVNEIFNKLKNGLLEIYNW